VSQLSSVSLLHLMSHCGRLEVKSRNFHCIAHLLGPRKVSTALTRTGPAPSPSPFPFPIRIRIRIQVQFQLQRVPLVILSGGHGVLGFDLWTFNRTHYLLLAAAAVQRLAARKCGTQPQLQGISTSPSIPLVLGAGP